MKNRLDIIHTYIKRFSLQADEKSAIRAKLLSYINAKPVVSPFYQHSAPILSEAEKLAAKSSLLENVKKVATATKSPMSSLLFNNFFHSSSYAAAFLVLVLVLGGGISLAAESALPGQPLYSVKTTLNEGTQSILAVSTEQQAALQIKFAEARLQEAEQLAVKGQLDPSVKSQIEQQLKEHTDTFQSRVVQMENDQSYAAAVSAASDFESMLKAHEGVLAALDNQSGDTTSVTSQVQVALADVQTSRASVEDKVTTDNTIDLKAAANEASAEADQVLADGQKYIAGVKATVGPKTYDDAVAHLRAANALISNGQDDITGKQYGNAFLAFQDALREVKEGVVSLQAIVDLHIPNDSLLNGLTAPDATSTPAVLCATDTITELNASSTDASATSTPASLCQAIPSDATSTDQINLNGIASSTASTTDATSASTDATSSVQ